MLGLYHQWWKSKTQEPSRVVHEDARPSKNPERSSPSLAVFYINYFQKTTCFIYPFIALYSQPLVLMCHKTIIQSIKARFWCLSIRMMEALDNLWWCDCVLDAPRICSVVGEVAQKYFDVYVKYCTNAIYQGRKLRELMWAYQVFNQSVLSPVDSVKMSSELLIVWVAVYYGIYKTMEFYKAMECFFSSFDSKINNFSQEKEMLRIFMQFAFDSV